MLVYGMGYCKRDVVLLSGMGCYYTGWCVIFRDGLLVSGMGCWYTGWCVNFRNGVLV